MIYAIYAGKSAVTIREVPITHSERGKVKMLNRVEGWLLNVFLGKLLARAAVTITAYVASTQVQNALALAGVHGLVIDRAELTAGLIAAAHVIFEYFKKRRMANPGSPAVQTDESVKT